MAKRTPENNRRRIIEEQRKKARAKERRKTIATIVICSVIGLALIGGSVYFSIKGKDKVSNTALRNIGVTEDLAGCLPVKEEEIPGDASDENKHTDQDVDYKTVPPSSGRHNGTWLPVGRKKFYTREENPRPELAVHNLEHAYVVVWYDKTATAEQLQRLKEAGDAAEGKFFFVPWTRSDFPDKKPIVLTAWGYRQQCSDVSGAVIQKFFDDHGGFAGKAPEKSAV